MKVLTCRSLWSTIGFFLLAVALVLTGGAAHAQGTTRYVATTGLDEGNCGSPLSPCRTVQYAVNVANSGDLIKVAAGIYAGVSSHPAPTGYVGPSSISQVLYLDKTVILRGGYTAPGFTDPPDPVTRLTILDAQRAGRVVFIFGAISPTLDGFMLVNGDAAGLGSMRGAWDDAGGLYVVAAPATVQNCVITGNNAYIGGGTVWLDSAGTLRDSSISSNAAYCSGGVVLKAQNTKVIGNDILDNNSTGGNCYGGGLAVSTGTALLEDNLIGGNRAYGGGGLYVNGPSVVRNNTIHGNSAWAWGGGGHLVGNPTLEGNVITSNTGGLEGGGGLSIVSGAPKLTNNVLARNEVTESGRGNALLIVGSSPSLVHNTIAGNTGGDGSGVSVSHLYWGGPDSSLAMKNTILTGHLVGIDVEGGNTLSIDGILWYDTPLTVSQATTATVSVQHQWTGDPAFAADGYHLNLGSAAVDRGIAAGVGLDIDGQPRPMGATYDLGADELTPHLLVEPETGGVLLFTDSQGSQTTISVPAQAVTETVLLVYTPQQEVEPPPGLAFAQHAFVLEAYQDGDLLSGLDFALPVTVSIEYSQVDLLGVEEPTLELLVGDDGSWQSAACADSLQDLEQNWLAVPICHLSQFGLFGERWPGIYLPLVTLG